MLEASSQMPQVSRVRSSWKTSEETSSPTADLVCQGLYEEARGRAPNNILLALTKQNWKHLLSFEPTQAAKPRWRPGHL